MSISIFEVLQKPLGESVINLLNELSSTLLSLTCKWCYTNIPHNKITLHKFLMMAEPTLLVLFDVPEVESVTTISVKSTTETTVSLKFLKIFNAYTRAAAYPKLLKHISNGKIEVGAAISCLVKLAIEKQQFDVLLSLESEKQHWCKKTTFSRACKYSKFGNTALDIMDYLIRIENGWHCSADHLATAMGYNSSGVIRYLNNLPATMYRTNFHTFKRCIFPAIKLKNCELVKYFIEYIKKISGQWNMWDGDDIVWFAARESNIEIFELVHNSGVRRVGYTSNEALAAVFAGNLELLKVMVERYSFPITSQLFFSVAAEQRDYEILKYLTKWSRLDKGCAIARVARDNDFEFALKLKALGYTINYREIYAYATEHKNKKAIKFLKKHSAHGKKCAIM